MSYDPVDRHNTAIPGRTEPPSIDPDHCDKPLTPPEFERQPISPVARPTMVTADGLPKIYAKDGDLKRLSDNCLAALLDNQRELGFYSQGGRIVRVEIGPHGCHNVERVATDHLRHALARTAAFFTFSDTEAVPAHPPRAACQDILATPGSPFSALDSVISTPFITPEGKIATSEGYYPSCRVLLAPAGDTEVPAVPENPTSEDVAKAKTLICGETLGEFPFDTSADLANMVALMVTPFIQYLVRGPAPLFVITKRDPGTGAGLLLDVVSRIAIGTGLAVMTEGSSDEEMRKRITTKLRSLPRIVVLDNLRRLLDSSALAAAITAGTWEDRIIGSSSLTRISTSGITWIATGNNVRTSVELARRSVRIGMDARMEKPWLRKNFRHPDLMGWVVANLGQLRWALLTLAQAWIVAGRPIPENAPRLGSFESWCDIVGGILDNAGIPGFLVNRDTMYAASDPQGECLRRFIAAWQSAHGTAKVGAAELFSLAESAEVDLGNASDRSRQTRLGILLRGMTQRRFLTPDGLTVTVAPAGEGTGDQSGAKLWTLVGPAPTATETPASN